jgi:hypothetical protein
MRFGGITDKRKIDALTKENVILRTNPLRITLKRLQPEESGIYGYFLMN